MIPARHAGRDCIWHCPFRLQSHRRTLIYAGRLVAAWRECTFSLHKRVIFQRLLSSFAVHTPHGEVWTLRATDSVSLVPLYSCWTIISTFWMSLLSFGISTMEKSWTAWWTRTVTNCTRQSPDRSPMTSYCHYAGFRWSPTRRSEQPSTSCFLGVSGKGGPSSEGGVLAGRYSDSLKFWYLTITSVSPFVVNTTTLVNYQRRLSNLSQIPISLRVYRPSAHRRFLRSSSTVRSASRCIRRTRKSAPCCLRLTCHLHLPVNRRWPSSRQSTAMASVVTLSPATTLSIGNVPRAAVAQVGAPPLTSLSPGDSLPRKKCLIEVSLLHHPRSTSTVTGAAGDSSSQQICRSKRWTSIRSVRKPRASAIFWRRCILMFLCCCRRRGTKALIQSVFAAPHRLDTPSSNKRDHPPLSVFGQPDNNNTTAV